MSEMIPEEQRRAIIDDEQLRLLAIGHYIVGGLCILFASFFIIHFVMFFFLAGNAAFFPPPNGQAAPPLRMFRVMGAVIGLFILFGWTFGGLTIYVGRCIRRRRRRGLSLVIACINLLFIPVGTLLGVASLMVLTRSSVKARYEP